MSKLKKVRGKKETSAFPQARGSLNDGSEGQDVAFRLDRGEVRGERRAIWKSAEKNGRGAHTDSALGMYCLIPQEMRRESEREEFNL